MYIYEECIHAFGEYNQQSEVVSKIFEKRILLLSIKFPAILRKLKKHLAKLIGILFGGGVWLFFQACSYQWIKMQIDTVLIGICLKLACVYWSLCQ